MTLYRKFSTVRFGFLYRVYLVMASRSMLRLVYGTSRTARLRSPGTSLWCSDPGLPLAGRLSPAVYSSVIRAIILFAAYRIRPAENSHSPSRRHLTIRIPRVSLWHVIISGKFLPTLRSDRVNAMITANGNTWRLLCVAKGVSLGWQSVVKSVS